MYEFWCNYIKPKSDEKAKFCYVDTDGFIIYRKTGNIYKYIAEDVETRFNTSNYELECNSTDRPLPKRKKKKVFGLMKNYLSGNNITNFFGLKAKTYNYLIDDRSEDKKEKGTKMCLIKTKLEFENYKRCLKATQIGIK